MKTEFIFEKAAGFTRCHASTIVELAGSEFLAAWFAGSGEGHDDTDIWGARLRNGKWSKPVELAAEKNAACWNPVLFKESKGRLWLFYKVGKDVPQWTGAYRISEDDGKTWGSIRYMPSGLLGPVRCKPLELKDGTLVCGTSVESYQSWSCWVELIRNGGKHWQRVGPITLPGHRLGLIQPTLWQVEGSHLRMYMRSHQPIDHICQSDSMDDGRTWSDAKKTDLPNNNAGIEVVKLIDGRLVLIYNHTTRRERRGGRHTIHLNVSIDNGETWGKPYTIEDDALGEYSYPAIIQAADGTIHATYTWNRVRVRHLTIRPDELKGLVTH